MLLQDTPNIHYLLVCLPLLLFCFDSRISCTSQHSVRPTETISTSNFLENFLLT